MKLTGTLFIDFKKVAYLHEVLNSESICIIWSNQI